MWSPGQKTSKSASSDEDFSGDAAVDEIISEEEGEEFMSAVFVQVENSSESDISLDMRETATEIHSLAFETGAV